MDNPTSGAAPSPAAPAPATPPAAATPQTPAQGPQPPAPAEPAAKPAPAEPAVQAGAKGDAPAAEPKTPDPAKEPPKSEELLADLPPDEPAKKVEPPPKPTREALKLPEKHFYTEEDLADILSTAPDQVAAQRDVDRGLALIGRSVERLTARNQQWIAELRDDPEFGGKLWEETKALYAKGVVQRFGRDFAADLRELHIDAHPAIVKDVVRSMRAAGPSPVVKPEGPVIEEKPQSMEEIANSLYPDMRPSQRQAGPRGLS